MSDITHFTDLEVWRRPHTLFLEIIKDVENYPKTIAASIIADQILRSCMSISANVSEGFNRSQKYFLNSLVIARGSCNETENWLYKLRDVHYISENRSNFLVGEAVTISKMIHTLMKRIRER